MANEEVAVRQMLGYGTKKNTEYLMNTLQNKKKVILTNLAAILTSILIFVLMIGIFEIYFYITNKNGYVFQHIDVLESHPVLGVDTKQNLHGIFRIQKFDYSFSNKTYTIEDGIRITPSNDSSNKKFIAAFGCSFTFGWGCNDDETFPARLGHYLSEYNIYNFGVCGGATQHMYWKLKNGEVAQRIHEDEGIGIYMFWGFHPTRITMSLRSPWAYDFPYYIYNKETDDLTYLGRIGDRYPFRKSLYNILLRSNTINRYRPSFSFVSNRVIEQFIDHLYVSKMLFINSFEKARFIVFLPSPKSKFTKMDFLKRRLQERDIEYIVCRQDYFDAVLYYDKSLISYPDGHLTPLAQEMLAQEFVYNLVKISSTY